MSDRGRFPGSRGGAIAWWSAAIALFAAGATGAGLGVACGESPRAASPKLDYPPAPRGRQVDRYHGTEIPDPYRWLEDSSSRATRDWLAAQTKLTRQFLDALPARPWLRRRLAELWEVERTSLPVWVAGKRFVQSASGLQPQAVLWTDDGDATQRRALVDPNALDPSGALSLSHWRVSPCGRWLAYGLSTAGSDRQVWRVFDLTAGKDLDERIQTPLWPEVAWEPSGDAFYYCRGEFLAPSRGPSPSADDRFRLRVLRHRPGSPTSADRIVWERTGQRDAACDASVTSDGRWLVIRDWHGLEANRRLRFLSLAELAAPGPSSSPNGGATKASEPAPLALPPADYQVVGTDGDQVWALTDHAAPRGRIVRFDRARPSPDGWQEVVSESSDTLVAAERCGERIVVRAFRDASAALRLHRLDGTLEREVRLPGLGTIHDCRRGRDDGELVLSFSSYATPPTSYRVDLTTGQLEPLGTSHAARGATDFATTDFATTDVTPAKFETERVHVVARDGARIPLYITRRRDAPRDRRSPLLLCGYGGFKVPMTPMYSATYVTWLELGGTLAVPNLRGGGELGRDWYAAGLGAGKRQVVEDFLAAAQWLVDEEYTSPERLAIRGVSHGGLVVGAALAQRPDLFAAAIPSVGVLDMLRYHRLPRGWAWASEYGTSDHPDQFRALWSYSPLHNLRRRHAYPATLVMTAEQDERVAPAHSYKFAATLQAAQSSPAPCLLRVETQAGHGAGTSSVKLLEASADALAFLAHALRMELPDSTSPSDANAASSSPPPASAAER